MRSRRARTAHRARSSRQWARRSCPGADDPIHAPRGLTRMLSHSSARTFRSLLSIARLNAPWFDTSSVRAATGHQPHHIPQRFRLERLSGVECTDTCIEDGEEGSQYLQPRPEKRRLALTCRSLALLNCARGLFNSRKHLPEI